MRVLHALALPSTSFRRHFKDQSVFIAFSPLGSRESFSSCLQSLSAVCALPDIAVAPAFLYTCSGSSARTHSMMQFRSA